MRGLVCPSMPVRIVRARRLADTSARPLISSIGARRRDVSVGVWLAVGAGVGAALGAATHNMAVWLVVGVALGVVIDIVVRKKRPK